jgi:type I restriction enzyme S subunit
MIKKEKGMGDWERVKLKNILTESKEQDRFPSPEKKITVRLNCNGVEKRLLSNEKAGATKYYKRKAGQFIYGKQNFHKGAFGIIPQELDGFSSSADLPAFDINPSCLPEWIFYWFKTGNKYKQLSKFAKGVGSQRISIDDFLNTDISLPNPSEQKRIIKTINNRENRIREILSESTTQADILVKLRQSILQEAIEGKLTVDWRKTHPVRKGNPEYDAAALLAKIKAEKQKLIAEGKIRKEKPLSPVNADDIPFALPEGWVWTRLGEIIELISGQHIETIDCNNKGNGFSYLTGPADFGKQHPIIRKWTEKPKVFAKKDDLLVTVKGSGVGSTNICNQEALVISRQLMAVRTISIFPSLIRFFILSKKQELQNAKDGLIPGITRDHILYFSFPLQPLAEQRVIVERLDKLLTMADNLEYQVKEWKTRADMLLQSVLKEAFEEKKYAANRI